MDSLEKLVQQFIKFPTLGTRQARRLAYFLMSQDSESIDIFIKTVQDAKDTLGQCTQCYRIFTQESGGEVCVVCSDANTDRALMMVVEKDADFENIKKSGSFQGRYFILGGSIPLLEKDPTKKVHAKELFTEVQRAVKEDGLTEVILALSANPEGENTSAYLKKILEPLQEKLKIKISSLGRGLSTGTELEYSDTDTIEHALASRG